MDYRYAYAIALSALLGTTSSGCAPGTNGARTDAAVPKATYDPRSGKLTRLAHDTNGDGSVDAWVWMDGARVVRAEADRDGDGKVDRWEYYGAERQLVKVGMSRARNGREDAWAYQAPDGSLARLDIATRGDGRVTRVERYDHGRLIAAESDEDGDGRPEKWEEYRDGRLASVALDTRHSGVADRRLVYGANGTVIVVGGDPER